MKRRSLCKRLAALVAVISFAPAVTAKAEPSPIGYTDGGYIPDTNGTMGPLPPLPESAYPPGAVPLGIDDELNPIAWYAGLQTQSCGSCAAWANFDNVAEGRHHLSCPYLRRVRMDNPYNPSTKRYGYFDGSTWFDSVPGSTI